jgi:hypothetical protein
VQAGAGDAFGVSEKSKVDICHTYLVIGDVNFLNHDCRVLLQVQMTILGVVEASEIPDGQRQRRFGARRQEIRNDTADAPRR